MSCHLSPVCLVDRPKRPVRSLFTPSGLFPACYVERSLEVSEKRRKEVI